MTNFMDCHAEPRSTVLTCSVIGVAIDDGQTAVRHSPCGIWRNQRTKSSQVTRHNLQARARGFLRNEPSLLRPQFHDLASQQFLVFRDRIVKDVAKRVRSIDVTKEVLANYN